MENCKVILTKFGEIDECVSIVKENFDEEALEENEVLLELIASTINPSDLGVILGTYGNLPELGSAIGREGIGKVIKIGKNVPRSILHRNVKFRSQGFGSWQKFSTEKYSDLVFVPNDLDEQQAAMAFLNPPTAYFLLKNFVQLKAGDSIVQNAANSAVGISVIQLAKHYGFKTINIVRNREYGEYLKSIGATEVFLEEDDWVETAKELLPKLALNSIGGSSALKLIKALENGGTHVTYGGMNASPIRFPTRDLIFRDIRIRGFWFDRHTREMPKKELSSLYEEIFDYIRKGIIKIPVHETFPLSAAKEALKSAGSYKRLGKILFVA